ncbi:MAG: prolyl oligopeptidase family serine peptidase [Vicinamibacterales bacterium]
MRHTRLLFASAAAVICAAATPSMQTQHLKYPVAAKGSVVDNYHGTKVADPYRWMEDLDSREVADWVNAENAVTFGYLGSLSIRDRLKARISQLWDYPKTDVPFIEGGKIWYRKNSGLQKQAPLYVRDSLNGAPRLVIDPNTISSNGTVALEETVISPDGKLMAYGLSEGGADWRTIKIRNLTTGADLPDTIKWMRFSGISWTKDARGFFYSRYPEPPAGKMLQAALAHQALYYHAVGTPQSQDRLIYERKDLPTWFIGGAVTEDGRYLLITTARGSDNRNRLYGADLVDPMHPHVAAAIKPLVENDDAEYAPIGNVGPTIYLRNDLHAPNRRIIALNFNDPAPSACKTIVAERPQAIEAAALNGGKVVAQYLVDVQSRLDVFNLDGSSASEIKLPGPGSLAGISGREDTSLMFYGFTSPLYPTTIFSYDLKSGTSSPFDAAKPPVDVSQYETVEKFAVSKDGTKVPYFMTSKKNLPRDGNNPTMLYGYGGFSISTLPAYRSDVPAWLELGGVWVTANMRGGAEYGEAWHQAGMLDKKQQVFDDFIAVAEDLIKQKITSPAKLGVMGGSNGGLLVGAVETERPVLFAVALPAVGVMDMLRYDRFTGGHAWATEYGSSSNPEQFAFLIKYSPLQNVRAGTCYPATLATTADHDDRVVPSHSFKYIATLQAAQTCGKPVLIRVETEGSHGYRPTDKRIAELADEWAFAAVNMGMSGR